MPMREDCIHFQSRTYDDGEVARLCVLNLAPEAPWRCPDNCPKYEHNPMSAGFVTGSLVRPPVEAEPDDPPSEIAGILDEADEIVTAAGPQILAEVEAEREREDHKWWRFWRKRGKGDDGDGEIHLSNR